MHNRIKCRSNLITMSNSCQCLNSLNINLSQIHNWYHNHHTQTQPQTPTKMATRSRADAQLNLYFGGSQRELKHSQSQANLLENIKSSVSASSDPSELNEDDGNTQTDESSVYLSENKDDIDDIYSVVAWQFGHAGSISDGAAIAERDGDNISNGPKRKFSSLTNRKGLKWYKRLFRQKSKPTYNRQCSYDPYQQNNDNIENDDDASLAQKQKLKRSKSTATLQPYITADIDTKDEKNPYGSPISIKLQSPTNRDIRFECLLYEKKKGKLRYKLMDHVSNKCICSNVHKFDVKQFLSKHRMSIDHELQLIQTVQQYKQIMLSNPLPKELKDKAGNGNGNGNGNENKNNNLVSSSSDSSSSAESVTLDTDCGGEDDEDSSTFDLYHTTTPRRKHNPSSRFMQFQHIISVIFHRYEKHTKQNPYLVNYLSLRKKQQNIESFYREKVADTVTIPLIADNQGSGLSLKEWSSGKFGLKSLIKPNKSKKADSTKIAIDNHANTKIALNNDIKNIKDNSKSEPNVNLTVKLQSKHASSGYSGDESSFISSMDSTQQPMDHDVNDGYLTDDEQEEEEEEDDEFNESEDEQSEDDSDESMDSDTLKRILLEAKEIEKKAKKQRKEKKQKTKTKRSKKKSRSKQASNKKKIMMMDK